MDKRAFLSTLITRRFFLSMNCISTSLCVKKVVIACASRERQSLKYFPESTARYKYLAGSHNWVKYSNSSERNPPGRVHVIWCKGTSAYIKWQQEIHTTNLALDHDQCQEKEYVDLAQLLLLPCHFMPSNIRLFDNRLTCRPRWLWNPKVSLWQVLRIFINGWHGRDLLL